MEDGSSDFSDWEVLSAASAAGGDDDVGDLVLVSGQGGGDVLYGHFALDSSPPAAAAQGSSSSEAESVEGFDSVSPEPVDLTAVADSTSRSQLGVADVTATWTARDDEKIEAALGTEIEAAHQEVERIFDSGETAPDGLGLQEAENSIAQLEDSIAQLEDAGADSVTQTPGLDAAAATDDEVHTAPEEEEPEQAKDASSGCGESDGDGKDCPSPPAAAAAPVAGEGGEGRLIVWWRLPFKLIHYCAWKVRPVWSISIAAAFLGIVVLGRRMYRMRRKTRGLPHIKLALDDKRAAQYADRAARLNEAFLIAKRVPALRTLPGAALPWSMMQER